MRRDEILHDSRGRVIDDEYVEYKNISAEKLLLGDADRNGVCDTLDFNTLAANFGGTGKLWANADFNADGKTDSMDFNVLAAHFSQTLASGAAVPGSLPVPEPSTAAGILALALAARHRARSD